MGFSTGKPAPKAIMSSSLVSGGADFGFRAAGGDVGSVYLPENYVSNTPVAQMLRISGESFASLGVSEGDLSSVTWDTSTGRDGINFVIVPESSSALLLLLGAFGVAVRRRRAT
jgi:hypothetical protein